MNDQTITLDLWNCLRHPRKLLRLLDAGRPSLVRLPYVIWTELVGIAILGSALYGASLSLVFPQWHPAQGALWLALSAGLAWCIFGPTLALVGKRNKFTCAHACLVTMAYGEAVLVTGASINLLCRVLPLGNPLVFNVSYIVLSDIIMALALMRQMDALGVPLWKTLLLWMIVLNGSGFVLFRQFQQMLQGGT